MWAAKRLKFHDYESDGSADESDDFKESFSGTSAENSELSSNYEYDCDQNTENGESNDESLLKNRLLKVLNNIKSVGANEFAISGKLPDAPLHAILIKQNQKIVRFPLFEDDLPSIVDAFKQSPYGKGAKTIVDVSFRNSWHLDPDDFMILNPMWTPYLKDILLPRIKKEMDIATPFEASLYKLLLYQKGSFFKPHRDTEKEERMFATLVIQLPSLFNGGQLVVEHDAKTKQIDFGSSVESGNEFQTCFTSFYCDCKHEILPVSDGVRICLVYNLVMIENSALVIPTAPSRLNVETQVASICEEWRKSGNPTKIVYGLSHKYTEQSISYESLKSTDKAVADALMNWSKDCSLAVFLGTLEKTWEGDECFVGEKYGEDDVQIDYVLRKLEMIGSLNPGNIPKFKTMSVDYASEMIPKNCFRHLTPFDKQKEETGNEGTILTLSYRHSALVVYPIENLFYILIDEGNKAEAQRIFLEEFKKFKSAGQNDDTKEKLLKWAYKLIPESSYSREKISPALLSAVSALNDLALLKRFLENHILNAESVDPIIEQCDKFGWTALSEQLVKSFKKLKQEPALNVLNSFVDSADKDEKKKVCLSLMEVMLTLHSENRHPKTDFLYQFCILAKRLNYNPIKYLKSQKNEIVVAVLIKLAKTTKNVLEQFWMEVAQYFLNKMKNLDTSADQKPVWVRNDSISCNCEDCAALSAFIRSNTKSSNFKLIKKRRLHLEKAVNGVAGLAFTTESQGRPPTMVVSKTEPSSFTASEEQIVARNLISKLTSILK